MHHQKLSPEHGRTVLVGHFSFTVLGWHTVMCYGATRMVPSVKDWVHVCTAVHVGGNNLEQQLFAANWAEF
jgi:hypothetical protein